MKKQLITYTALALLASASAGHATQLARELWDKCVTSDQPIHLINESDTAYGFTSNKWYRNMDTPLFYVDANQDLSWYGAPGLPDNAGVIGNVWCQVFLTATAYTDVGFVDSKDPRSWVARELTSTSQINCNANGVYYFSVSLHHALDGMIGIGFAAGTNANSRFLGAGLHWASYLNSNLTNNDTTLIDVGTRRTSRREHWIRMMLVISPLIRCWARRMFALTPPMLWERFLPVPEENSSAGSRPRLVVIPR